MTAPMGGCPECGRPIPPTGAKLCPHCGYPLLLDRPAAVEQVAQKIVYKPELPADRVDATRPVAAPGFGASPYAPPRQAQVYGPRCSVCRTGNPPHRKRCEVCGAELWPGAAFPPRREPAPPPAAAMAQPRRQWWKLALVIGIPVVAIGAVWLLAWLL
jgi:predicted amidophosphoribosyltransferase